jgi:hypothetical protein
MRTGQSPQAPADIFVTPSQVLLVIEDEMLIKKQSKLGCMKTYFILVIELSFFRQNLHLNLVVPGMARVYIQKESDFADGWESEAALEACFEGALFSLSLSELEPDSLSLLESELELELSWRM